MRNSATFWDFVKVRSTSKMGIMDMTVNEPPQVALVMGTGLDPCSGYADTTLEPVGPRYLLIAARRFRFSLWDLVLTWILFRGALHTLVSFTTVTTTAFVPKP
jgi:hypothetical protein